MSEQISYNFKCTFCGSNELLAKYRCNSVVAYPVTKLVDGDMRRDKNSRQEIWHDREYFDGYTCSKCGASFSSMENMARLGAAIKFDV